MCGEAGEGGLDREEVRQRRRGGNLVTCRVSLKGVGVRAAAEGRGHTICRSVTPDQRAWTLANSAEPRQLLGRAGGRCQPC